MLKNSVPKLGRVRINTDINFTVLRFKNFKLILALLTQWEMAVINLQFKISDDVILVQRCKMSLRIDITVPISVLYGL